MKRIKDSIGNLKQVMKLPIVSWAFYDFANTSFAVVIGTVVFPVFFTTVIANELEYGKNLGDLVWGLSNGISMLFAALCAPIFGAIADISRAKNKFLVVLTSLSIVFCFLLYLTGEGTMTRAVIIFIFANFFYQTSMLFYNSFLPELSNRGNVGLVSGFGFALGYLGGLAILLITYPLVKGGIIGENLPNIRLAFITTAVFFLIFSLPSFIFLRDKEAGVIKRVNYIKAGFHSLYATLGKIRKNRNLLRFLLSYFLFSNAFSILYVFAAVYGTNTLNISLQEIVLLFIIGHIPTIIFSFFFGWLVDRIGSRNVIILTLMLWSIIIIMVTVLDSKIVFYIVFALAAVLTGSTLIASRSLMTFLTPYKREAEYFSFYSIGGKFSAIVGPVVFGILAYYTKSEKIALLSTIVFLISGLLMIIMVKVPAERES